MPVLIILLVLFGTLAPGYPLSGQNTQENKQGPTVLEWKVPNYSELARRAHAAGQVTVEVVIDPDGKVTSTRFISGHGIFATPSRNAAMAWRFEASPGEKSNRTLRLIFEFIPDANSGCHRVSVVTPYYLRIGPDPPPETISYISHNPETRCRVHGSRLLRDKLEIIYGLVDFQRGYEKAAKKFFPNAHSEAFGGCLIEKEFCNGVEMQVSPKYAEVLYCSRCRRAQAQWIKHHRRSQTNSE